MKVFIIFASFLGLVLADTIPLIDLEESVVPAHPGSFEENAVNLGKELSFDDMLTKYSLTLLRPLLMKANLFDVLNDTANSHTVFAPTDAALKKVPADVRNNDTKMSEILQYHVHNGAFRTSSITRDMKLKTMLKGQKKIRFEFYGKDIYGSCQQLGSTRDETYNNGILDLMNGVMMPPEGSLSDLLFKNKSFSILQGFIKKVHLDIALAALHADTLLAPTDTAFNNLPADVKDKLNIDKVFLTAVLEYHVLVGIYCSVGFTNEPVPTFQGSPIDVKVSGGKVLFNNASTLVDNFDTIAYNGVFHTISAVLIPPQYQNKH